jgi:hypothetical protein
MRTVGLWFCEWRRNHHLTSVAVRTLVHARKRRACHRRRIYDAIRANSLPTKPRGEPIFGREVEYLKAKGYTVKPDGTAVKVK